MYTKESLARLGKQASDMYLKEDIPLSSAIVKIASSRPDMTKEHVQRVIENANLVTFEELFRNNSDKHVVFDLADPEDVHSELSASSESPDPIYSAPPEYTTYSPFDYMPKEAAAPVATNKVVARREYYHTKAAVDSLVKEASIVDRKAEHEMQEFIGMCKRASLTHGLKPVLQIAGYASTDKDIFSKVAQVVGASLGSTVKEGHFGTSRPNVDHPIYKKYSNLEGTIKTAKLLRKGLINAEVMHRASKTGELI